MLNVVGCYAECLALGSFMVKSTLLLVSTRSYVITGSNKNWTEKTKNQYGGSVAKKNILCNNKICSEVII